MALNFIDKAIEIFMLMRRSCTCSLMNILIVHKSMTFYEELKMKPVDYIHVEKNHTVKLTILFYSFNGFPKSIM